MSTLETRLPQTLVFEGTSTPTGNPSGEAWLYYDSTTNLLMLAVNGGGFFPIETLSNLTLQTAYDGTGGGAGNTINLDGPAVTFNNAQSVSTDTLDINVSAGTGNGITINMTGGGGQALVALAGTISCPQNTTGERFGSGSVVAATSVAVGNTATSSAANTVAIGANSTASG